MELPCAKWRFSENPPFPFVCFCDVLLSMRPRSKEVDAGYPSAEWKFSYLRSSVKASKHFRVICHFHISARCRNYERDGFPHRESGSEKWPANIVFSVALRLQLNALCCWKP